MRQSLSLFTCHILLGFSRLDEDTSSRATLVSFSLMAASRACCLRGTARGTVERLALTCSLYKKQKKKKQTEIAHMCRRHGEGTRRS